MSRKFVPRKNEVGNKEEGTTQRCNDRNDLSRLNGLCANDACPHCTTKEQGVDGTADAYEEILYGRQYLYCSENEWHEAKKSGKEICRWVCLTATDVFEKKEDKTDMRNGETPHLSFETSDYSHCIANGAEEETKCHLARQ